MYTFKIPPDAEGYVVDDGNAAVAIQLDGGDPRVRGDKVGAVAVVTCQWTVGPADADYIRAFYRTGAGANGVPGVAPFNISLVGIDSTTPQTYIARFVPGTFGLRSQSGLTYVYSAQLWVRPIPPTTAADITTITA
jgi:hypothetical protein